MSENRDVPERPDWESYEAPWWTKEWDLRQVDKTYQRMLQQPGGLASFQINRERDDGPEMTFSAEAVDEVLIAMRAWLYSRIHRFYGEHDGRGARHASISIVVTLEE